MAHFAQLCPILSQKRPPEDYNSHQPPREGAEAAQRARAFPEGGGGISAILRRPLSAGSRFLRLLKGARRRVGSHSRSGGAERGDGGRSVGRGMGRGEQSGVRLLAQSSCHLSPCKDVRNSDIRWIQLRSSRIVHHYQNGEDLDQMEEYEGRTELLRDGLSDGNLDLRITAVSSSDSGSYSCAVQDDDGYAEAVVNLEVSDPFSQIVHPWKVALPVVVTILVGSFVIIVFLYRKKVAQSRELKGKDAALAELPAILGVCTANLKILASKLMKQMEKLEIQNSLLKKRYEITEELAADLEEHLAEKDLSTADLKLLAAKLVEQREAVEERDSQLRKQYEKLGSRATNLKTQLKKLENEIEEVEKHLKKIGIRAPNLKLHMAELVDQAEAVEKRKSELKSYLTNIGLRAAELKKYIAALEKRIEALETKELEQPSKEQD